MLGLVRQSILLFSKSFYQCSPFKAEKPGFSLSNLTHRTLYQPAACHHQAMF